MHHVTSELQHKNARAQILFLWVSYYVVYVINIIPCAV